jgi:GIY-YIG catalytic domain
MAIDLVFRRKAVRTLTNEIGCYVLCDLDQVPIYVGQSVDGIRSRVNRHLTSARSDIITNRQIDVWEIAWVWAYPVRAKAEIGILEDELFHAFNAKSALMNGKVPKQRADPPNPPNPAQKVQVMADAEIAEKKDPALRLPGRPNTIVRLWGISLR